MSRPSDGEIYSPTAHIVDEWSKSIHDKLCAWAAERQGQWQIWSPGYVLLRINVYQGEEIEPVVLWTENEEITLGFGMWQTILPWEHAPGQNDIDASVEQSLRLMNDWLEGHSKTVVYFDAKGKWSGSTLYEGGDLFEHLQNFENFKQSTPLTIELRSVRQTEWRHFHIINQKQVLEIVNGGF